MLCGIIGGYADNYTNQITIDNFDPLGERGLFLPGQNISLMISGSNRMDAAVDLELQLKMKDFYEGATDQKSVKIKAGPSAAFTEQVEFSAPQKRGFFVVKAALSKDGVQLATAEAGVCVLKPVDEKDFFFVEVGAEDADLLKAESMIGITGHNIKIGYGVAGYWEHKFEGYARRQITLKGENILLSDGTTLARVPSDGTYARVWNSGFNLIGYIGTGWQNIPPYLAEEVKTRREQGLFPYSENFFKDFGDCVEATARVWKDKVKVWVIHEEIDTMLNFESYRKKAGDLNMTNYLELYVGQVKVASERLKKVDPECRIVALTFAHDWNDESKAPYFSGEKWKAMKLLLPRVKDYIDIIGPDAYLGSSWQTGELCGEELEKTASSMLSETVAFQKQLGKKTNIAIPEAGYAVPHDAPMDSRLCKLEAGLVARQFILAKSVTNIWFFAYMKACGCIEHNGRNDYWDMGLWKKAHDQYHPRPAVAAFATVARILANTTDALPLDLGKKNLYCYVFKKKDTAVAAIWTSQKESFTISVQLPAGSEYSDLMGNTNTLPGKATELLISENPIFISVKTEMAALADMLRKVTFSSALKGEFHLTELGKLTFYLVNQLTQPVEAEIRIEPPTYLRLPVNQKKVRLQGEEQKAVDFDISGATIENLQKESIVAIVTTPAQTGRLKVENKDFGVIPVTRMKKNVTVDGDLSKYADIKPLVLDSPEQVYPDKSLQEKVLWKNAADLSAKCYLAYDDQNLYLAFQVTDDAHIQRQTGDKIWKDDCVQFALNANNDALQHPATGKYHENYNSSDYNYGVALTKDGPLCWCWVDKGTDTGKDGQRSFPLVVKREDPDTIYEMAIPWRNVAPLGPKQGKVFSFSFIVFDTDNMNESSAPYWLGLTGGIADPANPTLFKKFVLME